MLICKANLLAGAADLCSDWSREVDTFVTETQKEASHVGCVEWKRGNSNLIFGVGGENEREVSSRTRAEERVGKRPCLLLLPS